MKQKPMKIRRKKDGKIFTVLGMVGGFVRLKQAGKPEFQQPLHAVRDFYEEI